MRLINAEFLVHDLVKLGDEIIKNPFSENATGDYSFDYPMGKVEGLRLAIEKVNDQCTVEKIPERGLWIYEGCNEYFCSKCDGIVVIDKPESFPYCPYCGAKMGEYENAQG